MSDDEDDQVDSETNLFDGSLEGHDSMGFGPLIPTESERSLMERVRQELKHELKQVQNYRYLKECKDLEKTHRISYLDAIFVAGIQGENCRYKGRNFAQEKSWKASW